MQPSDRQKPFVLSDKDNADIYATIKTDLLEPLRANENKRPFAFFLAAQPGSGKTVLRNHILDNSHIEHSTLVINTDELREYHPKYRELLSHPINFASAPYLVNPDSVKWTEQLRKDGITGRYNLLFDVTLGGNSEYYIKSMNELKSLGYTVHVDILAVKQELSRLGIHMRYERQLASEGSGRFVSMSVHDINYKNLTTNLTDVISSVDLDMVSVYKRRVYENSGKLVNNAVESIINLDNKSTDSQFFIHNDMVINAINTERNRKWTDIEKKYLKVRIKQVEELLNNRKANLSDFHSDISILSQAIS